MKEKKRSKVWDANYRPYGTNKGPRGTPEQWAEAFKARFSKAEITEIIGDDSPWDILGVPLGATHLEIKTAFRKRSMETHPDTNPGKDGSEFRKVKAAYEQLTPA